MASVAALTDMRCIVAAAASLTWQDKLIEGRGVTPSNPVAQPPEQLLAGEHPQMQKALELARAL
jgi:C-terminal processing protease CtpA/Prc